MSESAHSFPDDFQIEASSDSELDRDSDHERNQPKYAKGAATESDPWQPTVPAGGQKLNSFDSNPKAKGKIMSLPGSLIGPALPPGFKCDNSEDSCSDSNKDELHRIGPALPPGYKANSSDDSDSGELQKIGPALPPGFKPTDSDDSEPDMKKQEQRFQVGPALPPGFKREQLDSSDSNSEMQHEKSRTSIGPCLPPGLGQSESGSNLYGPVMPPGFGKRDSDNESEADDVIGPVPSTGPETEYSAADEFERRARMMKRKLTTKEEDSTQPTQRESWMTELPSDKVVDFGLGPRKFRKNAAPETGDRSAWTDTPKDRERKEREAASGSGKSKKDPREERYVMSTRDKEFKKQVEKYNESKRPNSLLDMHQKKLKKKKKKEKRKHKDKEAAKERRPFDRDVDLQTNRFDDAQRKALIKRSQQLGSKFGHGSSQFL